MSYDSLPQPQTRWHVARHLLVFFMLDEVRTGSVGQLVGAFLLDQSWRAYVGRSRTVGLCAQELQ